MTDTQIDIKLALRVVNTVVSEGSKDGSEYHYRGMTASSDIDGYNVMLRDPAVTLYIHFHNTFEIETPGHHATETFIERMHAIDRAGSDDARS